MLLSCYSVRTFAVGPSLVGSFDLQSASYLKNWSNFFLDKSGKSYLRDSDKDYLRIKIVTRNTHILLVLA